MKILYYNSELGSCDGSNSHATGMLRALRKIHGEENVVIANRVVERVEYSCGHDSLKRKMGPLLDPIRVARRKRLSNVEANYAVSVAEEKHFKPDVLLARVPLYDEAPVLISQKLGCKLVLEVNTPLFYECCDVRHIAMKPFVRSYEREMLNASDGIYCVSEAIKEMLEHEYKSIEEKAFVVPNGYDAELFADFEQKENIRGLVRFTENADDKFVVVFVGSLQTWHGINRLIDIAEKMEDANPAVSFWVLGDGPERALVSKYEKEHSNLKWFGNTKPERMKQLLYAADLGIMPYNTLEHFYFSPLKMYDMIGSGIPFVGCKIGQIKCMVDRYSLPSEFLVDGDSSQGYIERICTVEENLDIRESMRRSVYTASSDCTWDKRAELLTSSMEGIIDGAR